MDVLDIPSIFPLVVQDPECLNACLWHLTGTTALPERGTAVQVGAGLAAAVIAQKLGRRKKKQH